MDTGEDLERARFEEFKALHSKVSASESVGDPSLDVLLQTVAPEMARVIQALAIPHWFDADVLATVLPEDELARSAEILDEVLELPFIRSHLHGYTYHDDVRNMLRRYLMRVESERLRQWSHQFDEAFQSAHEPQDAEDVRWEQAFHQLAWDESSGLQSFDTLLNEARMGRRFVACGTLINMLEEQRPLLSVSGASQLDYYRGRLAVDLSDWDTAEEIFRDMQTTQLPEAFLANWHLYYGQTLEAKDKWLAAQNIYQAYLQRPNISNAMTDVTARVYQRLAEVSLSLHNLSKAQEYAQRSLTLNERLGNSSARAFSFGTLGRIYSKLGDLPAAVRAFENGLSILTQTGRRFDQAELYVDLADVYLSFGRWDEAERNYQKAMEIKIEASDNYGLAFIYANLGKLYLNRSDSLSALRHFNASLNLFEQFKDRLNAAKTLRHIALTYERRNKLPEALDHMRQALAALPPGSPWAATYQDDIARIERSMRPSRGATCKQIAMWVGIVVGVILVMFILLVIITFLSK